MHRCQVQRRLPSIAGCLAYRCEQQRHASDRLHARARAGRPAVPTPPVAGQRAGLRRGLAAVDVLRGEPTHPLLVLQLIKAVLAIGTGTVELPDSLQRALYVGDHHRVLPQPLAFVHAGARQIELELPSIHPPLTGDSAAHALAHDTITTLRRLLQPCNCN